MASSRGAEEGRTAPPWVQSKFFRFCPKAVCGLCESNCRERVHAPPVTKDSTAQEPLVENAIAENPKTLEIVDTLLSNGVFDFSYSETSSLLWM